MDFSQTYSILAQAPGQGQEGGMLNMLMMIGLIIVVFYFFMIRPQQKRAKQEKQYRNNLKEGDKVVTIGGIHGKITKVKEEEETFVIDLGNNTRITIEKSAVSINNSTELGKEKQTANAAS